MGANVGSGLKLRDAPGRHRLLCHSSSRVGKPTVGMKEGLEETSASFEGRSAPSMLPDLRGHERAYLAVMPNAASTPFSVLV